MTYTAHNPRLFSDAVTARLVAQTARPIGDAKAPGDTTTPYAVHYPQGYRDRGGSLTDRTQIAWVRFQVTCVGRDMDEAQWMQHEVREALLGWTPTVAGTNTTPVSLEFGSGVIRDDDLQPPLFYTHDRFEVLVS